jgi:hypothetical protein
MHGGRAAPPGVPPVARCAAYALVMDEADGDQSNGSEGVAELINRGVESLALVVELIAALKAKGIFTEEEVAALGKGAEKLRVDILNGRVPS